MTVRLAIDGSIETEKWKLSHRGVHKVTGGMALALSLDRTFREGTVFDHFGRMSYIVVKETGHDNDIEFVHSVKDDTEWVYVVSSLLMAAYVMAGVPLNPAVQSMVLRYEKELTIIDEREVFNEQARRFASDQCGEAAHDEGADHPEREEGGPERGA